MRFLSRIPWALLLLLLVGVAWSIRPISDTDILWHLRTGQWMLAHGAVIRHDIFSATRLGCDWVSVPWLYEVMLAKLYALFGWGGPTAWQTLMVMAVTLQTSFLVWLLRRKNKPVAATRRWDWKWPFLSAPAALAVLLTLRLLQMRINCRPEWNTYLFLGAFFIILTIVTKRSEIRGRKSAISEHPTLNTVFSNKNEERRAKNQERSVLLLWILPVLQILWTNAHGAFIFGPFLVWSYAVAAWVSLAWERGRTARTTCAVRLTLVAVLTTLACLATPYGLAGTFYPFHLFRVLTDPLYKNSIVEGQPVDLSMVLDSGNLGIALLACWVMAGLGLLGRVLNCFRSSGFRVRRDRHRLNTERQTWKTWFIQLRRSLSLDLQPGYLFSCAAMAYLSLSAIRNVPLLPLVVAPLVANGIEYAADGLAAVIARVVWTLAQVQARHRRNRSWFFVLGSSFENRTLNLDPNLPKQKPIPPCLCASVVAPQSSAEYGVALLHSRPAHILAHALLALVLLLAYRAIVSERFYEALGWRTRFAIGCSDHEHPLAACNFVAQHRAEISCRTLYGDTRSANLFLAHFGPQWPVYFDGRHAEIYDQPSYRTAVRTRCNPEFFTREAAAYGITLACFSLTDLKEDRSTLAVALGQTNSWRLVYLDDCAALFAAETPGNAAFVARYGLPCVPTNAALQRAIFGDWLRRQGRVNLAALDDPANQALETGALARSVMNVLQLDGLLAPTRRIEPLCYCRLAAFVDSLGWTVVADDLYQQALDWPHSFPVTLPRAIRHAHAVCKVVSDPAIQAEMRTRMHAHARTLQRIDPRNAVAIEALEEK